MGKRLNKYYFLSVFQKSCNLNTVCFFLVLLFFHSILWFTLGYFLFCLFHFAFGLQNGLFSLRFYFRAVFINLSDLRICPLYANLLYRSTASKSGPLYGVHNFMLFIFSYRYVTFISFYPYIPGFFFWGLLFFSLSFLVVLHANIDPPDCFV